MLYTSGAARAIRTTTICLVILVAGCAGNPRAAGTETPAWSSTAFGYLGKPVHPALVLALQGREKMSLAASSVDIAAGNEADFLPSLKVDGERILSVIPDAQPPAEFSYIHIGVLPGGTHVLETFHCEGGTGVFMCLLFVRVDTGQALLFEPARQPQLLMTLVGRFALGDRDDASVRLEGNAVRIGASRYRENEIVLRMPQTVK